MADTATCQHCAKQIVWVPAPMTVAYVGYTGYWYHTANQHVLCDGADAMEHATNRAAP
jgi:hypothetical protein